MGHGDVLGWLVDLWIRLWSFHDYNGSERFMRLYDATTGLSIFLSLVMERWNGIFLSFILGKV